MISLMEPARSDSPADRSASHGSLVEALARHVNDLAPLRAERIPMWFNELVVPARWRIAKLGGTDVGPARIVLCGQRPEGSWDGCETISIFGFTGITPRDVVESHSDSTLRVLGAENIEIRRVAASLVPGVTAVRSDGYASVARRRVWAQYSTYVTGSLGRGAGRLIQQCITTSAERREALVEDVAQLSNTLQREFLNSLNRQ